MNEINLLVRKMPVLNLNLLEASVVVGNRVAVFFLPLLSNLLLLDHDCVGALFIALVTLFRLEKLVLQVGNFDVALVVQLVDSAVENDLQSIEFGDRTLFLVSELVDELPKSLVVIEVALVVSHV